jgi:hypothetical protein
VKTIIDTVFHVTTAVTEKDLETAAVQRFGVLRELQAGSAAEEPLRMIETVA